MVILEDGKIERALFENREEAIIPIEITERDGNIEIITFEKTEAVARELEKRFASSLFSDEAIEFIHSRLIDTVHEWGYEVDDLGEGHIITFVHKNLNIDLILPTTKMIKSSKGYVNMTEYELENLDEDSEECYFATIIDNKIVSICEMNTQGVFIGAVEINTYTSPEYRGNGYSSSNVTAMCKYLGEKGKKIAYTVQTENSTSISVAEKCGFEKIAQTYYYICYRND